MELSLLEAKVTWNFRSRERKCYGTFVLGNKSDMELSLSIYTHATQRSSV